MSDQNAGNGEHIITDEVWLKICWNYFELMSRQRIQMIQFYIQIEIVLFGGFFALIQLKNRLHWAELVITSAVIFMSILFYGIDVRTKTFIHRCEDLMTEFGRDNKEFIGNNPIQYLNDWDVNAKYRMTYSKWFVVQFWVIGAIGFYLFCSII